jgi:hypothetical protein
LLNGSQAHEKDAEPLGPEAIGDFRWVDVDGSGRRALLVPISHSRAFFNSLEIYEQTSSGVHLVQKIEVWMLASLRDRVKDLDHDGRPELILPVLLDLEEYRGAWPVAMWPAVYRWSGGRFIEASRSFANYYGHAVFPELEAQRQRTEGLLTEGHGRFEPRDEEVLQAVIAATWMAQDKILRVIAEERDAGPDRLRLIEGDPTAGADRAREWMKSPFPQLRQDAALVFADIGARFEGELRSLAHDPDGDVATAARRGLDRLSRPLREGG